MVWIRNSKEVVISDGISTKVISDSSVVSGIDGTPKMNSAGQVVFSAYTNSGSGTEIFLYDGITTTQITNNEHRDYDVHLSENGKLVWKGGYDFCWSFWRSGKLFCI